MEEWYRLLRKLRQEILEGISCYSEQYLNCSENVLCLINLLEVYMSSKLFQIKKENMFGETMEDLESCVSPPSPPPPQPPHTEDEFEIFKCLKFSFFFCHLSSIPSSRKWKSHNFYYFIRVLCYLWLEKSYSFWPFSVKHVISISLWKMRYLVFLGDQRRLVMVLCQILRFLHKSSHVPTEKWNFLP